MKLLSADYFRDGGSLGAEFLRPDGTIFYVFLQIGHWDHPLDPKTYTRLYVSGDYSAKRDPKHLVAKGSEEELQLLADLDAFIEHSRAADFPDLNSRERLLDLRRGIEEREVKSVVLKSISSDRDNGSIRAVFEWPDRQQALSVLFRASELTPRGTPRLPRLCLEWRPKNDEVDRDPERSVWQGGGGDAFLRDLIAIFLKEALDLEPERRHRVTELLKALEQRSE